MTDNLTNTTPKGWQPCALPDFAFIVMGQSPSSKTYNHSGDGLPFFQGKAEFGEIFPTIDKYCSQPKKVAKQGATLLSVRAPVGPTNLAQQECCIGRGLAALHPCGEIQPKFLLYLFRSIEPVISVKGTGSTFTSITKGLVESLKFNLPPLSEQDRIVSKIEELFSELDKGVESLKTARAQLKVYRQAVLKHAFKGKLTAQWREENKEKIEAVAQLLARVKREREAHYEQQLHVWKVAVDKWKKCGSLGKRPARPRKPRRLPDIPPSKRTNLPLLPTGWVWARLGNISIVSGGLTKNPGRTKLPRKMKYLRVANVYADRVLTNDIYEIGVTDSEARAVTLQTGDLLIVEGNGSINQIGRVALWNGELAHCGHQNHLIRTRFLGGIIPRFFLQFLLSPLGRDLIVSEASSTSGLHTLSISKVSNLFVPIASSAEQSAVVARIEERVSKVDKTIGDIESQLLLSEALRQSILKRAFSGELVEQDSNDEPATVLLKRIKAEKASQTPNAKARHPKVANA